MALRRFLYLDESLVRESLAQADSGIFEEQTITRTNSKDGKLGGELRAGPIGGRAEKGKVSSEEIEQILKQTPESQYNRLHEWLEGSDQLTEFISGEPEAWASLKVGEVVAARCELEIPPLSRFISSPDDLEAFGQVANILGQSFDEDMRAAFSGISALSRVSTGQRIMALGDFEAGPVRIVSALKREYLRKGFEELETEATVVGILDRKISAGERHLMFNLPGMNLLPRAERRRLAQSSDVDPSLFVDGPLGIVTPLAIF